MKKDPLCLKKYPESLHLSESCNEINSFSKSQCSSVSAKVSAPVVSFCHLVVVGDNRTFLKKLYPTNLNAFHKLHIKRSTEKNFSFAYCHF
jgi:hypothetical protein